MATKITAVAAQRGTVPVLGRTIHGRVLRAISENERVSAATSGMTSVAVKTVKRRS